MTEMISLGISIVSVSVAVAAFVLARRDPRPRIDGQVNTVLYVPLEILSGRIITAIMVHLTLTNRRKNPAHIVSYDLTIDRGLGPERLTRLKDLRGFPTFKVGDRNITLNDNTLIYRPMKPVEYGDARVGLVVFYVDAPNVSEQDVKSIEMSVTDIFGHRYQVTGSSPTEAPGGFSSVELFELAGAQVTLEPKSHSASDVSDYTESRERRPKP